MELPLGMMTEEWARKMGDQLGTFQEIPKSGKRNLWDDFYRIRVELDVTNPIKRWVKFQDLKTRETLRYDVKYERMPTFCYFCGLIGHADKNCLLHEEEKRVRLCVEQKASPYRGSDHRSYYLPAEPTNVKRQL
jgi:cytochrome c